MIKEFISIFRSYLHDIIKFGLFQNSSEDCGTLVCFKIINSRVAILEVIEQDLIINFDFQKESCFTIMKR
jgi:hypothetical protein